MIINTGRDQKIPEGEDLSVLFGIDLRGGGDQPLPSTAAIVCSKCKGRGNFISHTGRIVGSCFTCNGSGISAQATAAPLKAGDCVKCRGTGEFRPGMSCFACNGKGREAVAADIKVDAIEAAFASALANGLKAPKLRLEGFTFSRAPATGRNAGSLYVKAGQEYMGKVTAGKFIPSPACDDPTRARVVAAAADPAAAAKDYGMKMGQCSCCGLPLTNKLSIELGIGPICRAKYGWG